MKKLSFHTHRERVLFTADLHVGHNKPFIINPRQYTTIDEAMTHTRETIYGQLRPDDILFNLGDAVIGAGEKTMEYANEIANFPCGHQYFIWGNHNAGMQQLYDNELQRLGLVPGEVDLYPLTLPNGRFTFLGHYAEIYVDSVPVVMSHYPLASWNHMSKGSYMLHGHCHRNLKDEPTLKRLDLGWDWKRRLVTWEEVDRELKNRKVVYPDHHGREDNAASS